MLIDFVKQLEERVTDIVSTTVGLNTDPDNYVITFDDHLHDVDISEMPFVVVTVRSAEKGQGQSIGQAQSPRTFTVHIYYLDINPTFDVGKAKRGVIIEKLEAELDRNFTLNNLSVTDTTGSFEYVYNTEITNVLFDYSGQDQYYTFVSEVYLTVYTDRG